MKLSALLIAAMLVPLARAHEPKKSVQQEMEPPIADVYSTANVRSATLATTFTKKAAELNNRRAALIEEGKKIDEIALSEKWKNSHIPIKVPETDSNGRFSGYRYVMPLQPPIPKDYRDRVHALNREMQLFRRETAEEFNTKRTNEAEAAKYLAARQKAIADATAPATPAPNAAPGAPAAPAEPVAEPKPSSVPGFPAGVEPAKKKETKDLPPGMTRR
jgi:hypothetical protein